LVLRSPPFVFIISFTETLASMRSADLRWIALAMVVYSFGFIIRSFRWRILMAPVKKVRARELYPVMMLGFLANNVLPFRMGELVRAHRTGRKFGVSRAASLGTILIERLFDTISFLTTFVVVAIFFNFPMAVRSGAWALGLACLSVIALLFGMVRRPQWVEALLRKSPLRAAWKTKLLTLSQSFTQGVLGMFRPTYLIATLVLSLSIWTLEGTVLFLIARSFDIGLGYPQSFFVLFFMGLAVTLPQAPGFVGTIELFGVSALSLLGIPKEQGLPAILTIHACQFVYILIVGFLCLWREGLSLRGLAASRGDV
jgi:glycosyltransferase 2 family protein